MMMRVLRDRMRLRRRRRRKRPMTTRKSSWLAASAALALATGLAAAPAWAADVDPARLQAADQAPNDWLTYHGTYKSYHYSPLDQINANNVKGLQVAWMHFPGRATRGVQSTPLVAD